MSENERRYRTLNGTMANYEKIVGYCRLHKVHLTEPQIKQKECIQKNCQALKKWNCAFWDRRERIKEVKQIKKEQGIPTWQKVEIRTDHDRNLLSVSKGKR